MTTPITFEKIKSCSVEFMHPVYFYIEDYLLEFDCWENFKVSHQKYVEKLYYWQYSNSDSFSDHIFNLIQKADIENKRRLFKGFPEYFLVYIMWAGSGDHGKDLFRYWNVGQFANKEKN